MLILSNNFTIIHLIQITHRVVLNIVLYNIHLILYIILLQVFKYILLFPVIGIIIYKLKNGLFNSKKHI